MEQYIGQAKQFLNFIDKSVSPYHAVESARTILEGAGFQLVSENTQWNLKPGGKYFFTRNQSTIVAFAIGHKFKPGNGFNVVGAHTDSPNLKIKPKSAVSSAGLAQVGVELYGGGLWHTWFDRDLTVAGRVLVKVGDKFESKLVKIPKPILRIPTLAIHLDRGVNTEGFKYNTQTHLLPIISSVQNQLQGDSKPDHHPLLLDFIAKELGVEVSAIQTFDLNLCDTLPGAIGGGLDEFIFSPRLDNLCMSYCSVQALADSVSNAAFKEESGVNTVMLFDNEEVGSNSAQGAGSPVVIDLIQRVTAIDGAANLAPLVDQAIRKSFLISADMAHALHPNYSSLHEPNHQPKMNAGPVIKHNANLRYATTAYSAFIIKELAKSAGVPVQEFVVKNDMACGSTIGPILATLAGIRTVDIGNPQLSMHSIREQCGVADVTHAIKLLKAFFEQFTTLDAKIKIDE